MFESFQTLDKTHLDHKYLEFTIKIIFMTFVKPVS